MKTCIACAEEIQNAAKLCKYCNTRQDDSSFASERKPLKKADADKLKTIRDASNLIQRDQAPDKSQLSSNICEEIFETVEVTNRFMGELSDGKFPKYQVLPRESHSRSLKLLGSERSNQNLAVRSKVKLGRKFFCDGRGWMTEEVADGDSTAFDRRVRMLCLPHARPALASALLLANEYRALKDSVGYSLANLKDQESLEDEDVLFVGETLRWLELSYLSIWSVPEIRAALEHHATQFDYRNVDWRGRQKPYRPFPWG